MILKTLRWWLFCLRYGVCSTHRTLLRDNFEGVPYCAMCDEDIRALKKYRRAKAFERFGIKDSENH